LALQEESARRRIYVFASQSAKSFYTVVACVKPAMNRDALGAWQGIYPLALVEQCMAVRRRQRGAQSHCIGTCVWVWRRAKSRYPGKFAEFYVALGVELSLLQR